MSKHNLGDCQNVLDKRIENVSFLRDRVRTVVNVLGDALGAGIVHHISQNDLKTPPNTQQSAPGASYEIETHKETQ